MGNGTVRFDVVAFTAGDGMPLNLLHAIGENEPTKGPVLLVHGAGVRANIFLAPVETNIVQYLSDNGYDVWLENWRASMDVAPNQWSLDQAAKFDHPKAVEKVIEMTGATSIKAIIHCQGSTSFMMSAVAGLVPQVDTIVSNAVSLHPVVTPFSKLKINVAPKLVKLFTDYMNPQWAKKPKTFIAIVTKLLVELTHHECNNTVCKHTSFIYGSGHPTLWRHENLNKETHNWLSDEFGFLPMKFFTQMSRSINRGHLLAIDGNADLPTDFVEATPQTDARFAFFSGRQNVCFLPESQQKTFAHFDKLRPNFHSLHVVENYGHLCMFMGKNAVNDVFPLMLAELEK
jgi:pimeloyl-ACP methyl ester carboxylesterase